MESQDITRIKELLSQPRQIIITTHRNPDGDAMGSSLGLFHYLVQKGHNVTVVIPNEFPAFLKWLPGSESVMDYSVNVDKTVALVKEAEIIFCLDFNVLHRIEDLGKEVGEAKAFKITIDHHPQPEFFADITFSDVKASSTCEMIVEFIHSSGDEINGSSANCLYTGIMTDTGSFRYPSTTSKTHQRTADLINAGANNGRIHDLVYDNNSISRLKLLGYCLSEKMQIIEGYQTAVISLSQEELNRFNHQKGDSEGIVNYPLSIKGIRFSAFMVERDGEIKISFRSKGGFSVNEFSRKNFSGGGHFNAAGGSSKLSLEETVSKFIGTLAYYKDELNKEE